MSSGGSAAPKKARPAKLEATAAKHKTRAKTTKDRVRAKKCVSTADLRAADAALETKNRADWVVDEYYKQTLDFECADPALRALVDRTRVMYSTLRSRYTMRWLLYRNISEVPNDTMPVYNIQFTMTIFRIRWKDKIVNQGYLYSMVDHDHGPEEVVHNYPITAKGQLIRFSMVSTGPTFNSADGEYRGRLVECFYSMFPFREDYAGVYREIVGHLESRDSERRFRTAFEHFFPSADHIKYESALDHAIVEHKIDKLVQAICWFNDAYNAYYAIEENHINPKYAELLDITRDDDIKVFTRLVGSYGKDTLDRVREMLIGSNRSPRYGQKIIPLTMGETVQPFNIAHRPWREFFIARRLSDFVVSARCCSFPLCNEWTYVHETNKTLFDNDSQTYKLDRSAAAMDIMTFLLRVRNLTGDMIENFQNRRVMADVKASLLAKFRGLFTRIEQPIEFGIEEVVLSKISLCIFSEYTGRTFMDSLRLQRSPHYASATGDFFKPQNFRYFEKYMFDLCFALLTMTRAGVIHCDLHLNNVTLRPKYAKSVADISELKDPIEIYVVSEGSMFVYCLPTLAYNTAIIDFSRAYINPAQMHEFEDRQVAQTEFAMAPDAHKIVDKQNGALISAYIHLFPEMEEYRQQLTDRIAEHPSLMFVYLSAIDVHKFTRNLLRLFEQIGGPVSRQQSDAASPAQGDTKGGEVPRPTKAMLELVRKMNDITHKHLTVDLPRFLADASYVKYVVAGDCPNMDLIVKCFPHYAFDNTREYGPPIDVFNATLPANCSLREVDLAPTYVRQMMAYDMPKGESRPTIVKHLYRTHRTIAHRGSEILAENKRIAERMMAERVLEPIRRDIAYQLSVLREHL